MAEFNHELFDMLSTTLRVHGENAVLGHMAAGYRELADHLRETGQADRARDADAIATILRYAARATVAVFPTLADALDICATVSAPDLDDETVRQRVATTLRMTIVDDTPTEPAPGAPFLHDDAVLEFTDGDPGGPWAESFAAFRMSNHEDEETLDKVRRLGIGETVTLGGGATPTVTIRRLT